MILTFTFSKLALSTIHKPPTIHRKGNALQSNKKYPDIDSNSTMEKSIIENSSMYKNPIEARMRSSHSHSHNIIIMPNSSNQKSI